ncbi:MAG TPA: Mur ligase family protein, partial [bacterium]|nr:Mur ligase family protein [bacterium]
MSPAELSPAAPVSTAPAPPAIELTFADLANLGCRVVAGAPGTRLGSIDIDSRRIGPGDWFLAHRGEQADGHDFLADVKARGAAGAIIEDPTRLPSDFSLPALQVDDHAAFLERLAKLIRDRFAGQVVGITGSVGKTTCKHTLAHLLSHDRAVLATPWNWNTEIGVPLTLSRLLSHGADVLVLELAM